MIPEVIIQPEALTELESLSAQAKTELLAAIDGLGAAPRQGRLLQHQALASAGEIRVLDAGPFQIGYETIPSAEAPEVVRVLAVVQQDDGHALASSAHRDLSADQVDVFIAYAAEDGESLAADLALALRKRGLRVWFDRDELQPGDRITRAVQDGLDRSRYALAIVSNGLARAGWAQYELRQIVERAKRDSFITIPVWLGVTTEQVASLTPDLVDRVALNADAMPPDEIATEVARLVHDSEPAVDQQLGPVSTSLIDHLARALDSRNETESALPRASLARGDAKDRPDELRVLVDEGELAAELEDTERLGKVLTRLASLIPTAAPSASISPTAGNLALRLAERGMVAESAQMHLLAIRANPLHSNVNQNFIEFALSHPTDELLALADEALSRLESRAEMADWRPLRTRVLRSALMTQQGQQPAETFDDLAGAVLSSKTEVGSELVTLLSIADRAGAFEWLPRIGAAILKHGDTEIRETAAVVRSLADGMAVSDQAKDENFAFELYLYLLNSGLAAALDNDDVGDTMFNLSVLLGSRGLTTGRGYLLKEAFVRNPADDRIRLRLARWYRDAEDRSSAMQVLNGSADPEKLAALEEPDLQSWLVMRSAPAQEWLADHLGVTFGAAILPALVLEPQ